jgi:hypothetical protein
MMAQTTERYDVLITEIFADPLPVVGLPGSEYIELKNRSGRIINLDKWRLTDGSSTAQISGTQLLQPDSQVIVCSRSQAADFTGWGRVIGMSSFPSLDNGNDQLVLLSPEGRTIHAVAYDLSWYQNVLKSEGGWSLEMIDTGLPCHASENWSASTDPSGGSPGRPNSIRGNRSDLQSPRLLRSFTKDSLTIVAVFSEPLDSLTASSSGRYAMDHDMGNPAAAEPVTPIFDKVILKFSKPMQERTIYTLNVNGVRDCAGNAMALSEETNAGLPRPAAPGQLRINEVMFNPRNGGTDHIELLNAGPGIIDASKLFLANRNASNILSNLKRCREEPFLIFPGDHPTFTADRFATMRDYFVKQPSLLIGMASLPSYPDDAGTVVVVDESGRELDEFSYKDTYHFPLLSIREGVSLERIDPKSPSNDPSNWHSASTDAGYGTPTGRNSQFASGDTVLGNIHVTPNVFSPDQDGFNDILIVEYRFPSQGYSCSVILFDQGGRPVRYLARNALCGNTGQFKWNGLDERDKRLAAGVYYVVAEAFNLEGKRRVWRKAVAMAYRF